MHNRLTVIIPTYNHGHLISDALDSIVRQTRRPETVIVFDDASTDDTEKVVRGYREKYGFIKFIRLSENQGIVKLLNKGLALADTEFVSFLAADDFIDDTLYEKSLMLLERHPAASLCGVLARLVDGQGRPLPRPADIRLDGRPCYLPPADAVHHLDRHGSFFSGNGAVYRTALLRQIGGFAEELSSLCDGYAQQLLGAKYGFCYIPEVLASWRRLDTGYAMTTQRDTATAMGMLQALLDRLAGPDSGVFPESYRNRLVNRTRFMAAMTAISGPDIDRDILWKALGLPAGRSGWLARMTSRILGRRGLKIALALYLRPRDIPAAMLRRLRMME